MQEKKRKRETEVTLFPCFVWAGGMEAEEPRSSRSEAVNCCMDGSDDEQVDDLMASVLSHTHKGSLLSSPSAMSVDEFYAHFLLFCGCLISGSTKFSLVI